MALNTMTLANLEIALSKELGDYLPFVLTTAIAASKLLVFHQSSIL